MKSRASIKSHPIHPILVSFPIAFYCGALFFDLMGIMFHSDQFWMIGQYLTAAGVITAIIAAVPGIIDYATTVPPQSTAKDRATKHALLNSAALTLFVVSLVCRGDRKYIPMVIAAIELTGVVLTVIAGWLGGTLVYRNQIGVDPRYAEAGKWKELYLPDREGPVEVAKDDELKVNQMKLVHWGKKRIVLARTDEGHVAFDDRCTHRGGSLAAGSMMCDTVQCPWHGSQFNVYTGDATAGPAKEKIKVYPLYLEDGKIFLR